MHFLTFFNIALASIRNLKVLSILTCTWINYIFSEEIHLDLYFLENIKKYISPLQYLVRGDPCRRQRFPIVGSRITSTCVSSLNVKSCRSSKILLITVHKYSSIVKYSSFYLVKNYSLFWIYLDSKDL